MEFEEALEIVRHIITVPQSMEYDGIFVKRLEASNTLDGGRTTNQTHIAISGEQMNIFPYIRSDGYFQCSYEERDDDLKKYFVLQIPLRIYRDNIIALSEEMPEAGFDIGDRAFLTAKSSVVRSRRKSQSDQVQLSLITLDDKEFIEFRKLLHTRDYLVLLKHKEKFEYDCFGVKAEKKEKDGFDLEDLNNKFYKLATNTRIDLQRWITISDGKDIFALSLAELADLLKNMYQNADENMKVASIHVFGIKYGKDIVDQNYKASDIIRKSGLNDSYVTELSKALNTYRCLQSNRYGICIGNPKVDCETDGQGGRQDRNKGVGNVLLYGVPGAGKSHMIKTQYCSDERYMERVVFHPDYTYSDFVG